MDRKDAEARILKSGWLAAQPAAFQAMIFRKARLTSFPAGSFVFLLGDDMGGIFGVVDGGVGIHVPHLDGSVTLAHVARSGVWFGQGPLITGRRRGLEFSVIEPSTLFHVPLGFLDEIGGSSPGHARSLYAISEFAMDVAISTVATLQIRNVERRIAATLLRVAPVQQVPEGEPVEILLTQSQLGEMANAARDVVNRTLGELAARGWLRVSYKRITLLDVPSLRSLVASGV